MQNSNTQLEDYARENDDRECYEAVLENREVMKRFEERIELLRREVVEVRGLPWRPQEDEAQGKVDQNVEAEVVQRNGDGGGAAAMTNGEDGQERRNGDSAAAEQNGHEEDGVFL